MAVKKLIRFINEDLVDRLDKEPNRSSLVEQLVAAHYRVELNEEDLKRAGRTPIKISIQPTAHQSAKGELPTPVLNELGHETWPAGTKLCGVCGKPFLGETCLCQI